jgi:hypothetical protein
VPRGYRLPAAWPLAAGTDLPAAEGLLHTLLGGSWTLKAAPDPTGAAAPSLFNDGVAGVSCPVAVLGVVAGFHVDTKLFKQGLILTRAG